jgi:hypothetical protein
MENASRAFLEAVRKCMGQIRSVIGATVINPAKRTYLARDTVRRIVRGQRSEVFRTRQSSLEEQLPWLDAQWDAVKRNSSALWRSMRVRGFRGSARVVSEGDAAAVPKRQMPATLPASPPPAPSIAS